MSALTLPGFANVHSHAFQRLMRGDVQRRDASRADSFWTWREQMYHHALTLDLAGIEAAARLCYREALEGGYTALGEFHYLHHDRDGGAWPDPVASARVHCRVARELGLRLTLLWTVYARGGIDQPLGPLQRRFATPSIDDVWRALDALGDEVGDTIALGLALHSVRAVPRSWMRPLVEEARRRGLVVHAHAAEQPAEVDACRAAFGLSPVALLAAEGVAGRDVTLVHATWIDDDDIAELARAGTRVALCPTTEGDLGDGFARADALHHAGVPMCIGSDSHVVLDPLVELRAVEYLARRQAGQRCVIVDAHGAVAPALLSIGSDNGYAALGLSNVGDRITLRDDRVFEGTRDRLAVALTSGHRGLVDTVEVAGHVVVSGGRHVGA